MFFLMKADLELVYGIFKSLSNYLLKNTRSIVIVNIFSGYSK